MEKIPFEYETKNLCNYFHVKTCHGGYNLCQNILLKGDYYWGV